MSSAVLLLLLSTLAVEPPAAPVAETRPTVAVAAGVSETGAEPWLGFVLGDGVTTRLLIHSRFDSKKLERVYPLNLLGWRQVASAARAEGLDAKKPLSAEQTRRLDEQLGADWMLVTTYVPAPAAAKVRWRLRGGGDERQGELEVRYDDTSAACETLAAVVLKVLGQDPTAVGGHHLEAAPAPAARAFGEGLAVLARQSLDPRARIALTSDELRRAHDLFAAATEASPELARAWVERGVTSAMLGDAKSAEDELVQAMAQFGDFEPASSLGLYYFYDRQGRTSDALKVLEEATTTHLGFLQGLGYLAEAYARAGRTHEALQTWTAYITRVPKSPWAAVQHAAALARLGKHALALDETQKALERFPRSLTIMTALAARQLDAEDYESARDTLTRASQLAPGHPVVLTLRAQVALVAGDAASALTLAQAAVAAVGDARGEPLAGYAHVSLAHALELAGKRAEALAALRRGRELGVGATDLRVLWRDERVKGLLTDPGFPRDLLP